MDEPRAAHADVNESPKETRVVHPARQDRARLEVVNGYNAPFKVLLTKI